MQTWYKYLILSLLLHGRKKKPLKGKKKELPVGSRLSPRGNPETLGGRQEEGGRGRTSCFPGGTCGDNWGAKAQKQRCGESCPPDFSDWVG